MENQRQDNEPIQNPQAENSQPSSQKPNKKLIVIAITVIVIVLALAAISGIYWWQKDNINRLIFGEERKACTMEAKLCLDGSYVGRTGPNCEFAPCPVEDSYYEELSKICQQKNSPDCCLASVSEMKVNGYKPVENGNCPSGYKTNALYCIDTYTWCEPENEGACKNLCGDGTCEEVVCMTIGCPCAETKESCPQDCAEESGQVIKVSIADILSNPNQYLDKKVQLEEKFCGWGQTTGSAGPLFTRSDWCVCQNPQEKEKQSLTVIGAALPADVSPTEKESIGKILSIIGIVKKTANNISYIEASEIKKIVLGICEINKEYRHTAVEPIECQCPEDYEFKVVEMGWGPCPETGISDCPASTVKCVRK